MYVFVEREKGEVIMYSIRGQVSKSDTGVQWNYIKCVFSQ